MAKIKEKNILKALNSLEALAKGGDALLDQDTEGGLSTEGEPLSKKAPSGKSDAKKSAKHQDDSSEGDAEMNKASPDAMSDDSSGDDDDMSGDDDSGEGDDDSSPMDTKKSFADEITEGDEDVARAVEVSDFLNGVVTGIGRSLDKVTSQLNKSFSQQLDQRLERQTEFNVRLAKGIAVIGKLVQEIVPMVREQAEIIKSFQNKPTVAQRKSVLNKSEVQAPPFGGDEDGDDGDELVKGDRPTSMESAQLMEDWLVRQSEMGKIDPIVVINFEQNGYRLSTLPLPIRKSMLNDIGKAQ